ncbi:AAA family ATPase [Modestobacter italicus]|uniref:AAA family ATPase n=1 Tax=Modestobacter italicus (strain DSM 44449 / CECT 9708 / BC 501) TaxID=2732864 RepID=UPI0018D37125|nr:AAA family ATPase [Modestobacter marinus]
METHEEERVLTAVQAIVSDEAALKRRRSLAVYTLSKGLHSPGTQGRKQEPVEALAAIAKVEEPTVFVFFDLHHSLGAGGRPAEPAVVRALLDAALAFKSGAVPHTLVLVAPALTLPIDLEKVVTVVDLPLPDATEIAAVLDEIVAANAQYISVNLSQEERQRLVQAALGLTRWEAENAFARAIAADGVLDASDISLVQDEKRQTIRKSGLLEYIPSTSSIDDVGGLENLKRWLGKRNNAWLADAVDWSVPPPKGILITGIPGCGKSLTAKCVSTLWGLPLLRMDIGKVFSGLVGSSEQNMRGALKLAEAVSPSILWIDEIEKGFGSSGGGDSGTSSRVFGTFLTWMQEKSSAVFVIATANKIDALPPEFLRKRRFDEIFFVDLPTAAERRPIWELHLSRRLKPGSRSAGAVRVDDSLLDDLVGISEGFSGAEIEQAVISACFDAFAEQRALLAEDLRRAVDNTVPLSITQAEQITQIRRWADTRAVAATATDDRDDYAATPSAAGDSDPDVASWRGGRTIDF